MSTLNIQNITARFCELTHLTEEEAGAYASLISSAEAWFSRLLTREPEGEEIALCEYSCACKAFFDYAVLRSASEKTYSTSTGGVFTRINTDVTVKNSERLWNISRSALPEGLLKDCSFVFEGVAG